MRAHAGAPFPRVALYDLQRDPGERCNVADDPAYRAVREDMAARLRRWMTATNDPLLAGPLRIPPGAVINTRECLSPREQVFEPAEAPR